MMKLLSKLKKWVIKQKRFVMSVDLPEDSNWYSTLFQHELDLAITNGFTEITTIDGSSFRIINNGRVKTICRGGR